MTRVEGRPQAGEASRPYNPVLDAYMGLENLLKNAAATRDPSDGRFQDSVPVGTLRIGDAPEGHLPIALPVLAAQTVFSGKSQESPQGRRETSLIIRDLLAGVVSTHPPTKLSIVVCDGAPSLEESNYLPFNAMNTRDPRKPHFQYGHTSSIPGVIQKTHEHLLRRQAEPAFRVHGVSLRHWLEAGQIPPISWRVVVLMGDGKGLDRDSQARLDAIAKDGARHGISLICGGGIRPTDLKADNVTNLKLAGNRRIVVTDESDRDLNLPVYLDEPLTDRELTSAIRGPRYPLQHGKSLDGGNVLRNARHYLREMRLVQRQMDALDELSPAEFPYFDSDFLQKWIVQSPEKHAEVLRSVFTPGVDTTATATASRIASGILKKGDVPGIAVPKLMAWTTYQLALATRRVEERHVPEELALHAKRTLDYYLPHLNKLAGYLLNPASLPSAAKYMAPQPPEELPPWLFQTLADAAYPNRAFWPDGECPKPQHDFAPAVIAYLVKRFYPDDFRPDVPVDSNHEVRLSNVTGALIELSLMELYQFEDPRTPAALKDALAWRAATRLASLRREVLPKGEKALPDSAMDLYKRAVAHLPPGALDVINMTATAA